MAECHIVHLGRDSRILAVTTRLRREPGDLLIVDFEYRGNVVPLTEIRLTEAHARALANEITDGLIDHLTGERDEARRQVETVGPPVVWSVPIPSVAGQPLFWDPGGEQVSGTTGSSEGSTPSPSTP